MSDGVAGGILAERRDEWNRSLERFDDALSRVERLIALTERAHERETAGA
jgi:hypothetical protein